MYKHLAIVFAQNSPTAYTQPAGRGYGELSADKTLQ